MIQEARIEQMNDQRRRMKQQELKRAAAALLEERRAAKEAAKRQEDEYWRAQKQADAVILHIIFIKLVVKMLIGDLKNLASNKML